MASKHAKLKLALTRAIIDFFLKEDLYADELKIQGTLCVTADRSAIFVTQITETVNEAVDAGSQLPHRNTSKKTPHGLYPDPRPYSVNDVLTECPEDLTCKSGRQRAVERQPPAAHTKNQSPFHSKPAGCLTSPSAATSHVNKSEPWPLPLNSKTAEDLHELPSMPRSAAVGFQTTLNTPGLSLLENSEARTENLFSLNSAILNAAAKSAIERLTSLSRENEQLHNACTSNAANWNQVSDGSLDTSSNKAGGSTQQKQLQLEVIDCSSSKKRRLDLPNQLETGLKVAMPHSNDLDIPQGLSILRQAEDEPLMLVTPKRERISDDEEEPENLGNSGNKSVGMNSNAKNSNTPASSESSPRDGQHKLHSPPSSAGQQQPPHGGCLSPWSFSTSNMKEEPSSLPVAEWSSADWMRKPRTKFSQEQLQALETEYKNDPFLSTSADKRAELARRLSITEKNVQIWFQNQRRRRRAAAYSQMHYTLNDSTATNDGKTPNFSSNSVDNTECTLGSPEFISDHDGENSRNCTPGNGEIDVDADDKHLNESSRMSYAASLDDSSSSDLIIATDLSAADSDDAEPQDKDNAQGQALDQPKGQHKSQAQPEGKGQGKMEGKCTGEGGSEGQKDDERELAAVVVEAEEKVADSNNPGSPPTNSAEVENCADVQEVENDA